MDLKKWLGGKKEKELAVEDLLVIEPMEKPVAKEEGFHAEPGRRITFDEGFLGDVGYHFRYIVQNETKEKLEGCYGMVSVPDGNFAYAQFFALELNLNPGETMNGGLFSMNGNLGEQAHYWVRFENKAELEAFLEKSGAMSVAPGFPGAGYTLADKSHLEKLDLKLERANLW